MVAFERAAIVEAFLRGAGGAIEVQIKVLSGALHADLGSDLGFQKAAIDLRGSEGEVEVAFEFHPIPTFDEDDVERLVRVFGECTCFLQVAESVLLHVGAFATVKDEQLLVKDVFAFAGDD